MHLTHEEKKKRRIPLNFTIKSRTVRRPSVGKLRIPPPPPSLPILPSLFARVYGVMHFKVFDYLKLPGTGICWRRFCVRLGFDLIRVLFNWTLI